MRAAIVRSTESIELIDTPSRAVGSHDVRVRVERTGLCGSDVHAYLGTHPFRKPPKILGHEAAGYVAEVGRRSRACVSQGLSLLRKGGRRVVVALFDEPITLPDPFQLVGAEAALLGSQMYRASDFHQGPRRLALTSHG